MRLRTSQVDQFIQNSQGQQAGTASKVLLARDHPYVSSNQSIIPRSHYNNGLPGPVGLEGHTQAVGSPYEMTQYNIAITYLRAF